MDGHHAVTEEELDYSSALWDWGDLLDFAVDDHAPLSLNVDHAIVNPPSPTLPLPPVENESNASVSDRIRKRDPMLTCPNFLAGLIPCACPEFDKKLEEEEASLPAKKRARSVRAGAGKARCQVLGCEADISELKGYHKRHRVCLRCANASSVLLEGETKRYCQQCGKFHILSDFDEGKRSCRRKLERHNHRRRRKPINTGDLADKRPQDASHSEDLSCEADAVKDGRCLSSPITDEEALLEFEDQHKSANNSGSPSQNINNGSVTSFVTSGETQMDGGKTDGKLSFSSSNCDDKSAYSSLCPTGRISFKLYDWNPAEFPRRLRHQIFQWLASMPVELEGYVRPGCTILTVFIAMPEYMWAKLTKNPLAYMHNLIVKPGNMLFGRGSITVHLNNMILQVEGGTSVIKVNVKVQAPRLHYVHPTCFEAGKPIEFIACGSNLLQPKFRLLISFAGKYMVYDHCVPCSNYQGEKGFPTFGHQFYKTYIGHTEPNLFGPAFIEVENEAGLSNFIPVLIGSQTFCSEMKSIQQKFDAHSSTKRQQFLAHKNSLEDSCEAYELRQTDFSAFVLDIAWLLKEPVIENMQQTRNSSQILRLTSVLRFLINNDSAVILEKLLKNIEILVNNMGLHRKADNINDDDVRVLLKYLNLGRDIIHKNCSESSALHSDYAIAKNNSGSHSSSLSSTLQGIPTMNGDLEASNNCELGVPMASTSLEDPLLNKEVIMNMNVIKLQRRQSCSLSLTSTALRSRPAIFCAAIGTICCGLCLVFSHPHKIGEFAVSIRRCLFDKV